MKDSRLRTLQTPPAAVLRCGRFTLELARPLIMGVVNVTPDSFSDGGRSLESGAAIAHARRLVDEGADLIDIGAESSRPGAEGISADQELSRLVPVLEGLSDLTVPVSVDTTKPEVMRAAIGEGATMINDIGALRSPGALEAVSASDAGVCLMHMQGEPRTMQREPRYGDVVAEVRAFLAGRVAAAGEPVLPDDRHRVRHGRHVGVRDRRRREGSGAELLPLTEARVGAEEPRPWCGRRPAPLLDARRPR